MDGTRPEPFRPEHGQKIRVVLEGWWDGGDRWARGALCSQPDHRSGPAYWQTLDPDSPLVRHIEAVPDTGTVEINRVDLEYVLRCLIPADEWQQRASTDPAFARLAAEIR
jgi:hypothetical protein